MAVAAARQAPGHGEAIAGGQWQDAIQWPENNQYYSLGGLYREHTMADAYSPPLI